MIHATPYGVEKGEVQVGRTVGEAPKTERAQIIPGAHTLTLKQIKDVESEDIFNPNEDGSLPVKRQLLWIFQSDKKGPDGKFYEHATYTGLYYGNERANMTHLLDWMLPDVAHEDKRKGVDVDGLIGRQFKARIQMQPNQKGELRPRLTMLDPIGEAGLPASTPFDPDEIPV